MIESAVWDLCRENLIEIIHNPLELHNHRHHYEQWKFEAVYIMENANFYYYFLLCAFLCAAFVFYIKFYTVLNEVSLFIAILSIYCHSELFFYSFHFLKLYYSLWRHYFFNIDGNIDWKNLQRWQWQNFYKS